MENLQNKLKRLMCGYLSISLKRGREINEEFEREK
jgi:hypothetical protein